MIGQIVSHYRILEPLGQGGMGIVYKAEDTRLGRQVAIKFLPPRLAANRDALDRFQREARLASSLNHPNICTLLDIGGPQDQPFLVMELLEGEPLNQHIAGRPLPAADVIELGMQIADALDAAHAKGVVHRDLKPANLFLTARGQVKILDFGVAKLSEPGKRGDPDATQAMTEALLTGPGTTIGTVSYMSPEQALGQDIDARSDLFSLGVVLYEMAAGVLPFAGKTSAAMFDSILHHEPAPPSRLNPDLPAGLDAIILKCLEKDRQVRCQSAAELRADLKRLARGTASTTAVGIPAAEPVRRSKRGLWVAAAAVALTAAGAAWFLVHRAGTVTEKDTVVLADFANATGDAVFDVTLKHALAVQLTQSPYLNILSEPRVRESLKLMGRSPDERVTGAMAREICQRNAYKAYLAGSIAMIGKGYVIGLDAVNCASGDPLAREEVESDDKEHVLKALGKAASQMRARLGESLASIQKMDAPIEQATTSSLEAFQAYALGDVQRTRGAEREAIPFFEHAIQLDPNFAVAYGVLGVVYANLGDQQRAAEYFKKAYALLDRVSEREKLYLLGHYYQTVTRESDKTNQTLELMKRTFPRDSAARVNLALNYLLTGQLDRSIEEYREVLRLDPTIYNPWVGLAGALIDAGRLDEAKGIAAQAIARGFQTPGLHRLLFEIAFLQDDGAGMARQADWGREKEQPPLWMAQANAAASLGQRRRAGEDTERAIEISERRGFLGSAAFQRAAALTRDAQFGFCDAARRVAAPEREFASPNAMATIALALATCGENSKAEKLADTMYRECPTDTLQNAVFLPQIRALIALHQKQGLRAVELLKSAVPYERNFPQVTYTRGLAYLQAVQAADAAAQFEIILSRPGQNRMKVLYPLSQLGLARAAALAGDRAKARKAYQDFLAQWKDADADIPALNEARQEYQHLQ